SRSRTLEQSALALAGAIGNRAMGNVLQRQPAPTAEKTMPVTSFAVSREEVEAAEAWIVYLAQRGRVSRPTKLFPERYRTYLTAFDSAVRGAQDDKKTHPVADSRFLLSTLRGLHDELIGDKDYKAYALADVALKRAAANARHEGGEGAFDVTGASELDLG